MQTRAHYGSDSWFPDICQNRDANGHCCCGPTPNYFLPPSTAFATPLSSSVSADFASISTSGFGSLLEVADARRQQVQAEKASQQKSVQQLNAKQANERRLQGGEHKEYTGMTEDEKYYWMKVYPVEKKRIDEENERIARENGTWVQPKMTYPELMKAKAELKDQHANTFIQKLKNPIDTIKSLVTVSKKTQLTQAPLRNTRIPGG